MGNWRTVNITGTCAANEVEALRKACDCGPDYENCHCLCFYSSPSLAGLNDWTGESISAIGNLSERDYSVEDVAEACRNLALAAPSLSLKIHCGGEYESKDCIATITVKDGTVTIGPPENKTLMEISEAQVKSNLMKAMGLSW